MLVEIARRRLDTWNSQKIPRRFCVPRVNDGRGKGAIPGANPKCR